MADVSYVDNRELKPKTSAGEWITSILFAIVAATIVHTYFFQPFVIPSSSLEKSLLVGDFLIVSKIHYGARAPMTTVGAPMVHDTIPVLKTKSYLFSDDYSSKSSSWKNKLQLPYFRLPGFEKIDRNEIVVFNQPADTLQNMDDFTPDRNYYKPIDKKTNLVKRCVGVPGDSLEVRDGYVYINGERNVLPDRTELQFFNTIESNSNMDRLFQKYGVKEHSYVFSLDTKIWGDARIQEFLESKNVKLDVVYTDSLQTHLVGGIDQELFNFVTMHFATLPDLPTILTMLQVDFPSW